MVQVSEGVCAKVQQEMILMPSVRIKGRGFIL
jgi:hypothetical protein